MINRLAAPNRELPTTSRTPEFFFEDASNRASQQWDNGRIEIGYGVDVVNTVIVRIIHVFIILETGEKTPTTVDRILRLRLGSVHEAHGIAFYGDPVRSNTASITGCDRFNVLSGEPVFFVIFPRSSANVVSRFATTDHDRLFWNRGATITTPQVAAITLHKANMDTTTGKTPITISAPCAESSGLRTTDRKMNIPKIKPQLITVLTMRIRLATCRLMLGMFISSRDAVTVTPL